MVTLGLLAGVVGCLAKPCTPERWTLVKAARHAPTALAVPLVPLATEGAGEPDRESEPGFADGLAAAAA